MSRYYGRYRDSGVEWLGDVPQHWDVTRLARVIDCLDGRRIPLNAEERADYQGEYPYWGANGVLDYLAGWLFDEPLVLLGEDGSPFFAPNERVAFSVSGKIWVNNHAHVLRPIGIHQDYLTHLLNITEYAFFVDGSTRDKLTQGQMNAIPIVLPPLDEQHAIAIFLDRETERIDALVAKKRRLIERLQEYRTALITRTVTRGLPPEAARTAGLDPSPRLKPSGADWLGDVPENWEVLPFQRVLQEPLQYGANEAAELDDPSLPRFVRITDIDRTGRLRDDTFRSLPVDVAEPYILLVGDLLFARSGATVGRTFLYDWRFDWARALFSSRRLCRR